jgi:hypothetical protein
MISGIGSQYAAVVQSRTDPLSERDRPGKKGPGDRTDLNRPNAPALDMRMGMSGSVPYEPRGLLADLSGPGKAEKIAEPPQPASPLETYRLASLRFPRAEEEPLPEPPTHTFEIVV